ncbi:MAG: exo-alpha-sialidase [Armatimonadetes bacterium]|nr:exo-alpha-sialidase [Armatimonadota bacterium]
MKIIARGTVAGTQPGGRPESRAFPGICVLPSGRWLCGFRAAPVKAEMTGQRAMLSMSDDQGRTWSRPVAPFEPPDIDGKPGLFRALFCTALGGEDVLALVYWVDHSQPELPFFNEETQGLLGSRLFMAQSADAGQTWTAPKLIDTDPFHIPTPPTGPVLVLPDGSWACQFELNKPYLDPEPWRHASVLLFSPDQGCTWPEHVLTSKDPANRIFYWDQRPAVLGSGRMLDLFWTYDTADCAYLNIHARESLDLGRTWSEMWDTGVPGQPAQPLLLDDGRLLMVYVDRTGAPAIKARLSSDGGQTWPETTELLLCEAKPRDDRRKQSMQDAWDEMTAFALGLPATAKLPEGDALVVYYSGPEPDDTDIKWLRLRA